VESPIASAEQIALPCGLTPPVTYDTIEVAARHRDSVGIVSEGFSLRYFRKGRAGRPSSMVPRDAFERLVAQALAELPRTFSEKLDNVEVVVEEWPDRHTLRLAGVRSPVELLGFYQGTPQTKRTRNYGLVLPDKISIYQGPIEMRARTADQIRRTIERVLRHEIAHHFGLDDARLREIGAY